MWILSSRRSAFALEATFLSGFCLGVNRPVHVCAADFDLCHAVATPTTTPTPLAEPVSHQGICADNDAHY